MLSRILIAILAVELIVYALTGLWLAQRLGISALWAVPLLLVIAVAVRLGQIGVTFAIATACRGHATERPRLALAAKLKLFLVECAAFVAMFSVLQPLRPWLMKPPATGGGGNLPPVVLVHGYFCNAAQWWWFRRYLQRDDTRLVFTIDLEPPMSGIDELAAQLAQRVERICETTGAARVVLVAHSMGGLVARAYLQDSSGASRVAGLITLGSPHHGSALAYFGSGCNAQQMRPGNSWLSQLNARENEPPPVPIVSIFSWHDNFVAPQRSAVLANASNIALSGLGHLSMLFSEDVAHRVRDAIANQI